jgi:predicted Zn-dependent protease
MTNVKWYFHGSKNEDTVYYIDRVKIQLPNDILDNQTIVRHEFGHAMGLGHSDHPVMKKRH